MGEFKKSRASAMLDQVRALSALLVLIEHWRNIFFIDFSQITSHRMFFALPYLLTSGGHQAVVIFFVLSGYLIGGSVFRLLQRDRWSWRSYLLHRGLRLWIVLIPGLMLCWLWDEIGIRTNLAPLLYRGAVGDHTLQNVVALHTAKLFVGNLIFMQTILVSTFGSDSALWSLSYEFWYYLLFPLGLFAVLPKVRSTTRLLSALLCIGIGCFVGKHILLYFPIWLSGALLALVPAPKFGSRYRTGACIMYLPMFYLFAKLDALNGGVAKMPLVFRDYLLAIATFFFLWALLSATESARLSKGEQVMRQVSRFSYTMYVVHLPLCVMLAALLVGDQRWTPSPCHILLGLLCLAALIAYAFGIASLTEFKTDVIRKSLEAKLGLVVPSA